MLKLKNWSCNKWRCEMRVIISGGGTGGHVFPAIAIADEIRINYPKAEMLFVGANGKIEMEKVPKAGYPIKGLNIAGFHRKLTIRNLMFPVKLIKSMIKARQIVKDFGPDIVVGVGGYASGPVLKISQMLGVPTLIQEQNSYAGVTNKLLAKNACKICVAYPNMEKFFPSDKILFTGNPVRKDLYNNDITTTRAKAELGLVENKKTILIFGGSLGARSLNNAISAQLENLCTGAYNVIWQVGKLYYNEFNIPSIVNKPNVTVLPFIEHMDLAYAAADLIVCRAGALTISEISLVKKAAILVPSPNVAENHQYENAMALVKQGAALVVKDSAAKKTLVPKILELMENDACRVRLSEEVAKFGMPNAANRIAEQVVKLISSK